MKFVIFLNFLTLSRLHLNTKIGYEAKLARVDGQTILSLLAGFCLNRTLARLLAVF